MGFKPGGLGAPIGFHGNYYSFHGKHKQMVFQLGVGVLTAFYFTADPGAQNFLLSMNLDETE
jgi:hypothetical protein